MDWNLAIEKNGQALKRIVAALVAMAGAAVLPRRLRNAVLRLLRPAEAATRRLVIVAARDIVAELPPQRLRPPKPKFTPILGRNGVGTGIWIPPTALPRAPVGASTRARAMSLSLTDPLRSSFRPRRPVAKGVPRISVPGYSARFPIAVRRALLPDDPIDAARLGLRLQALGRVLDDLPAQARRFARWRATRDAAGAQNKNPGRGRRLWPLKPGRPPGSSKRDWLGPDSTRRPSHEVHDVLHTLHGLAFWALQRRDSS